MTKDQLGVSQVIMRFDVDFQSLVSSNYQQDNKKNTSLFHIRILAGKDNKIETGP